MDVRCEKCGTEYVLDDEKVSEAGVTVRCTECEHVFKVRRGSEAAGKPASMPVVESEQRSWLLRKQSGETFAFDSLATLHSWIVERRVVREDSISRSGGRWKKLGEISELATFFQVVDQADQAARAGASASEASRPAPAVPPASSAPPPVTAPPAAGASVTPASAPPVEPTSGALVSSGQPPGEPSVSPAALDDASAASQASPAWTQSGEEVSSQLSPAQTDSPQAAVPAWTAAAATAADTSMDDEDFEEFRRGGAGKWVILVLPLLAAGAGGFYLLDPDRALDLVGLGQEGAQAGEDPASLAEDAEEGEALAADEQAGSEDEEGSDENVESQPDAAESDEDDPGQEEGGEDPAQEEAAEDEAESPAEERAADEEEEVEAAVQEEEPAQKVARQPQRRPPTYRSLLRRAGTARNRGRIETALDLYGEASKLRPNGAEAYSGQGFCYIEMRAWHAAIAAFEQALEHNSRYGEAIIGAAEAHRLQGNTNRAKRYYQRYIELYPDGPEAAVAQTNLERM